VIKNFAFSLPSQPFLGCHFGFHIFFCNSILGVAHFFYSWAVLDYVLNMLPHGSLYFTVEFGFTISCTTSTKKRKSGLAVLDQQLEAGRDF